MKPQHDPKRDKQTVTSEGKRIVQLPQGVIVKELTTHLDARGTVFETYNPEWNIYKNPVVFSHIFTIRPGFIKGWGMHKLHDDRYCLLFGEMELVLFDDRKGSLTNGLISVIEMSEFHRKIVVIPSGVWHAAENVGTKDVAVLDMPTKAYLYKNPDKYRLPISTKKIPYQFRNGKGW